MVKIEAVREKAARAAAWLDNVELILSLPEEKLLANSRDRDLASFHLFLAAQECTDLVAHWIAGRHWDIPDDAASAFDLLVDRAAIDRDLAIRLRATICLRDHIAQGDLIEDYAAVQGEYREGIASLRRFLTAVAAEAGL